MAATSKTKHIVGILLGILIIFLIGFFIGKCTRKESARTEYIPGEVIRDTVYQIPEPSEEVPPQPIYITKLDTLYLDSLIYVHESVDTTAILSDWIKKRSYDICLFDVDTLGTMNVHADIQYNKLQGMSYDYAPVYKKVTEIRKPLFTPFVMGGINSHWRPELEVGTFIKNFGISGSISHDSENMQYSIKIGYKFK